jgi:hypothetical protein
MRWLFGDDRRPRRALRLVFFVAGAVGLGAVHLATGSEAIQLVAFLALAFGAMPAFWRLFGDDDGYFAVVRDRNVPLRVVWPALVVAVTWGAVVLFAIPEAGLGPSFGLWVVIWPSLETFTWCVERGIRRGESDEWPRFRGLRDIAWLCLTFVPIAMTVVLLRGDPLWMAAAVGIAAGGAGFAFTAVIVVLMHRAAPPS